MLITQVSVQRAGREPGHRALVFIFVGIWLFVRIRLPFLALLRYNLAAEETLF